MSAVDQIIQQIAALPPDDRRQLVQRLDEPSTQLPAGAPAKNILFGFAPIDDVSAREMIEAIEADCERIDASDW